MLLRMIEMGSSVKMIYSNNKCGKSYFMIGSSIRIINKLFGLSHGIEMIYSGDKLFMCVHAIKGYVQGRDSIKKYILNGGWGNF